MGKKSNDMQNVSDIYKILVSFQGLDELGINYANYEDVRLFLNSKIDNLAIQKSSYSLMGECWIMDIIGNIKENSKEIKEIK